jgi:hypothetical protein
MDPAAAQRLVSAGSEHRDETTERPAANKFGNSHLNIPQGEWRSLAREMAALSTW